MSIAEKKWLTNYEVIKAIGIVLIAASAWFRLEYKIDRATDNVLKKIDEHIVADGFEKQIMKAEISQLKISLDNMNSEIKEYVKNEFIMPERPTIKRHRE